MTASSKRPSLRFVKGDKVIMRCSLGKVRLAVLLKTFHLLLGGWATLINWVRGNRTEREEFCSIDDTFFFLFLIGLG